MSEEAQQKAARRGLLGLAMLTVPIVGIVVVGISYVVLYSMGAQGRMAEGPQVRIDFEACEQARPILKARVDWMGLPDPVWADTEGAWSVTTRLPAQRPDAPPVEEAVPATLAAPGVLEVREGNDGAVLVDRSGVASATVEMTFLDMPRAVVELDEAHAITLRDHMMAHFGDHVSYWLDGQRVMRRDNLPAIEDGRLEIILEGEVSDLTRLDFVAATALVVQHGPLPCPVRVLGVHTLETP